MSRVARVVAVAVVLWAYPGVAAGQSATYHLHKEASTTAGVWKLLVAGPDAGAATVQSADLKNQAPGEYLVKAFDTPAGVPGLSGTIPAGSSLSFTLWMRKTASAGTLYPRVKVSLNTAAGAALCAATGTTPLTTTLTPLTLSCTTATAVPMGASDRFFLWAGVQMTAGPGGTGCKAVVGIEGTLNGANDSRAVLALPVPVPSLSEVDPVAGVVGAPVTVSGANFGASQGASTLMFNGVAAAPTAWSATSITAPVPTGATTGPIVVTVSGLASNGVAFTVLTPPSITSVTPGSGVIGASVTVAGTNFGDAQDASTITFNGVAAAPTAWSMTSITTPVPVGATSGPVVVTVDGLASTGAPFTVLVPPSITALTPNPAAVGYVVTITGTDFGTTQGAGTVTFNGTAASVTSWGDTSLTATVPIFATSGPVIVTVGGLASNAVAFTALSSTGQPGSSAPPPPPSGGTTRYYHTDAIGSVRMITRQDQQVEARFDYLPFGEEWESEKHPDPRRFAGKERDRENEPLSDGPGLDYFGARYYASQTGRFTTVDPVLEFDKALVDPQRWNRYTYVRNNALRFVDPDGRAVETIWDVISLGMSAKAVWQDPTSVWNWVSLGADVVSLVGPGIPAIGMAIRCGGKIDDAVKGARSTFEIASEGGKHAGFLRNYAGTSADELRRGVASLEKDIATHLDKIKNPEKYIEGFNKLDPRQQKALLEKKWPGDIQRQREQLEILRRLLEETKTR